jgi:hypothetical protein
VDSDGNICLVIGWCPSICCKAQDSIVLLELSQVSYSTIVSHENATYRPTCSIFAICLWTHMKTFFTSRETVSGEGTWYPGHPVFMRDRNAWSFMTWKGHLLSETQRMISTLCHSMCKWLKQGKS